MRTKILKFFESYGLDLSYYCFDIDDNLFHMPTVIHMDKLVDGRWVPTDVSTSEFASVRNDKENYRLINDDPTEAFCEFRDTGKRGNMAFIEDMKIAIRDKKFGPAWDAFVKCLTEGSLFALITARGNEPSTYRKSVEYIIDHVLTEDEKFLMYSNCLKHSHIFSRDKEYDRIPRGVLSQTPLINLYLDNCDYYGVSSQYFAKEFGEASASNPELAKEKALDRFIEKCNELGRKVGAKSVSVGFSDDDAKNIEHVHKYFKEKSLLSKELNSHKLKLNLYKTTDRNIKGGERVKYYESNASNQAPGMASSVMPFLQFNNMAERLFPSETSDQSPTSHTHKLYTKQLSKMSKEYVKPVKKKKSKFTKKKID